MFLRILRPLFNRRFSLNRDLSLDRERHSGLDRERDSDLDHERHRDLERERDRDLERDIDRNLGRNLGLFKAPPRKTPLGKIALALAAFRLALGHGEAAMAQGLGELGANVTSNINGVAKAILVGGFALGLYLVISGLMEFYNANRKPNCSFGGGATRCVIGACLLAVEALIASFSTTIFGGNESGTGLGALGF